MKPIFRQPIGTLRRLGTRREWLVDIAGALVLALAFALVLFLA